MVGIEESEKNMNEDIKKSQESIEKNVRTTIFYLKQGWHNLARKSSEEAEKELRNIAGFSDSGYFVNNHKLINAVKGLSYYYSLKNPSENVDYALDLIHKKQVMRGIKKRFNGTIESSSIEIDGLNKDVSSKKVATSLSIFKKYINSDFNEEYDKVISDIDKSLRICGVGKVY